MQSIAQMYKFNFIHKTDWDKFQKINIVKPKNYCFRDVFKP